MRRRSRYDKYYEDEENTGGTFLPPQKFSFADYLVA